MKISLLTGSHIMRKKEDYEKTISDIKTNLSYYLNLTTPKDLFLEWLDKPYFYNDGTKNKSTIYIFSNGEGYRLGYWLILLKLSGEDYYTKYADEYVEVNKTKIQNKYSVDITKLKEFLDTYTVGSLA